MSFTWPLALLLLLLVPLALLAYYAVQQRRPKYAARFTNLDLLANVVEATPGWRRHLPAALYLGALATLLLAVARPHTSIQVPKEEATVILVMDVSGSMNAEDVEPTRLAAAQDAANVLLDELPEGFRVSLVTFSTGVQTRVLPTADRDEVRAALERLQANGGTAMGDALDHALDITLIGDQPLDPVGGTPTPTPTPSPSREDEDTPFVVVLLSDGYNTAGTTDPLDAADEAVELQVPVFTIALGTEDGVAEVTDGQGRTRTVRVPPDEETLEEIADRTGARFFSAPSAEELESVYEDLGSRIGYDSEERDISYAFAGAGVLLVIAAGALSLLWFNRFP
ncbi:MAG: VWA domain-containing protein [Dehalococcoidia bacterium]|nr:VWA domain-containing protein [Dehalococcoidia bacterium]